MGLQDLLHGGTDGPIVLLGAAALLGVLHALEPGHSKTLMAAFIVAVRGTVRQAVALGLTLAISHTLIVWLVAWVGLTWGEALIGPQAQPYFVLAAGAMITAVGIWTAFRAWTAGRRGGAGRQRPLRVLQENAPLHHLGAQHRHDHHHRAHAEHVHATHDHRHPADALPAQAVFAGSHILADHEHDHDGHGHGPGHGHDHHDHSRPPFADGAEDDARLGDHAEEDAHRRAHEADIRRHFSEGRASMRQVVLFGMASGLIPCTAAVSVLLISLQQKNVLLGIGLVAAFTAGLAAMLVSVGVLAASGTARADKVRWLQPVMDWAPCASGVVLAVVGLAMLDSGLGMLGI